MNLYNEIEPNAAAWMQNLMDAGEIPQGKIDARPIQQLTAADFDGVKQFHTFAGIGGWPLALKLAGWGDEEVWTGSCPCQPYSSAGKQKGNADERNLWPAFFALIKERRPNTVFGEQVSAAIKHGWIDQVFSDLESIGYVCGASVLTASVVGANHIRSRLYWGAFIPREGQGILREKTQDSPGERNDTTRAGAGKEVRDTVRSGRTPGGVGTTDATDALRNDGAPVRPGASDEQITLFLDSKPGPDKTGEGVHNQEHSDRGVGDELRPTELGREGTGPSDAGVAFQERLNVLISARIQSQIEADQNAGRAELDGGDSVGANHIRQRLYWGACLGPVCDPASLGQLRGGTDAPRQPAEMLGEGHPNLPDTRSRGNSGSELAQDASGLRRRGRDVRRDEGDTRELEPQGEAAGLGVGGGVPLTERAERGEGGDAARDAERAQPQLTGSGPWSDFRLVLCTDGKARRTGARVFPLAYGLPRSLGALGPKSQGLAGVAGFGKESIRRASRARIGMLKGSGNAIVPALAAEFIMAFMETIRE